MKKLLFLLLFFAHYAMNQLYAQQIIISRIVRGGDQMETIKIYSDKKTMYNSRKKDGDKSDCGNCYVLHYFVKSQALERISNYINSNCKSSPNNLGKINDDQYFIVTKLETERTYKLDDKSGKTFITELKEWIQQSSFTEDCKEIVRSLQSNMINSR